MLVEVLREEEGEYGIYWIAWVQLDDLNLTDNLAFLFYTHEQIQVKTISCCAKKKEKNADHLYSEQGTSAILTMRK